MSQYVKKALGKMTKQDVYRSLKEMGYTDDQITIGKRNLVGYENRKRKEQADISIEKRHLSGAANDIGFSQKSDSSWELIESEYDGGYGSSGWGGAQNHFLQRFKRARRTGIIKHRMKTTDLGRQFRLVVDKDAVMNGKSGRYIKLVRRM